MTADPRQCDRCGAAMAATASLCPACGWDQTVTLARPPRPPLWKLLAAALPRLLAYGVVVAALVVGFGRWARFGPADDLGTTLRWLVRGDGGRSAELVTIHRAHEISKAASRYAVREQQAPDFTVDWDRALAPYATLNVRGWIPLLFAGADTGMAPAPVRELYEVRASDGWGRPWRVTTRELAGSAAADDPQVAGDLAAGLWSSFFQPAPATLSRDGDWLRLELDSAGPDGRFDSADDIRFTSYLQLGVTIDLQRQGPVQRQLEVAYTLGRHRFRIEGARGDLIDARLLAEFRLELWR